MISGPMQIEWECCNCGSRTHRVLEHALVMTTNVYTASSEGYNLPPVPIFTCCRRNETKEPEPKKPQRKPTPERIAFDAAWKRDQSVYGYVVRAFRRTP